VLQRVWLPPANLRARPAISPVLAPRINSTDLGGKRLTKVPYRTRAAKYRY